MASISFPLALAAGLLSFISPCVLPLVPVYLGYLSGSHLTEDVPPGRWLVLRHAGLFVGGFTLVFIVVFGLPATILGSALQEYSGWSARIGGVLIILFGLHTLGLFRLPFLAATRRLALAQGPEPGYARSALFGATFAAGWTPCVGPLLGTVLTLALTQPQQAIVHPIAYAAGLAVPFLLAAAFLARATGWLKRLNRYGHAIEVISGVLMIGVGLLLVSGAFSTLNAYFIRMTPDWLLRYL
jgi:cytochrome c-type biogenesis protein